MKIPSTIWTLLIGILLTLASFWLGQNHGLLPTAASDEAFLVDGLFNTMMTVSAGIFLIVEGVLIFSAIKYRRRKGDDTDAEPIHGNVPLEILWTAIPAIIVLGISVYSFDVYNSIGGFSPDDVNESPIAPQATSMPGAAIAATLDETPDVRNIEQLPEKENAPGMGIVSPTLGATPENQQTQPDLVVKVTGLQYAFLFNYPESGVFSGELHVPIGKEVYLDMAANDVIHAFWVPEFRLKQDLIPGRQTQLRFTPRKVGDYKLICAELCGPYHGAMNTTVVVQSPEDFDNWIKEQQVASKETMNQAVAVNPAELSADEFLAPYTNQMGISSDTLEQIHN
ncbi:heme/copper-type cytochrome/quinol oxidase, subunit 2 [Rivularia sp. PCC 7116]|uniref:cytochrome c oxidase subunit II n=1 Tax=Rivularia sp. PCC 7116 TaxID=373994 RepID=UPI00029F49C8|nr:cytochrome c oxidase subunit II [Rivularia sp. PCC 7116]AFY52877.1 heme/copper-type cytochrome/quinol oxidase, subunit 2 [Rivularia sp. PCC 7116]